MLAYTGGRLRFYDARFDHPLSTCSHIILLFLVSVVNPILLLAATCLPALRMNPDDL